jgi:hypothetical protein
MYRDIRPPST